jgi:hypothetical protein
MLISEKHKFVFFCMEKCASNSIEDMLIPFSDIQFRGRPAFRHTNFLEFEELVEPYLRRKSGADFETICIVREPVSWLYSWYRFRARFQLRDPGHPKHMTSTAGLSFAEFVEAYISPSPPAYAAVGSQFNFVRNKANEVGIRTVFAYEALEQFVDHMSHLVGEPLRLGYKNVSSQSVHSSAFVDRISAMTRRVGRKLNLGYSTESLLVRDRQLVAAVELPSHLLATLREHCVRDFELHDAALRKHSV